MTIRAVLAKPRGGDASRFSGVYLHNAGSACDLGPTLWTLMRDRYALDAQAFAREMIDGNVAGWSSIDCLGGPLARTWDGRTKITVDQHQANFNDDREDEGPVSFQGDPAREVPGLTEPPITESTDNWGADIVYVIAPDGLRVLRPEDDHYETVATLPWNAEPDWDAVDEALWGSQDDDDSGEDDEDEEDDDDAEDDPALALETAESNAATSKSFALVQRGDIAGAQALLLRYLDGGGMASPTVLTNLFYMFAHAPCPAATIHAWTDRTLAMCRANAAYLTVGLIENVCVVMNNHGRGAESLDLFELALAAQRPLNAACYVGMTYGTYQTKDAARMQRAVAHVERAMAAAPEMLAQDPTVFDNTAALYVELGDTPKALAYIQLCKDHRYVNFDAMPTMPDYAAIKDLPAFRALFAKR